MEDTVDSKPISENGVSNRKDKRDPECNGKASKKVEVEEDRYDDDIYLEERIDVPEPDGSWFSWRKLWLFTGPGWLSKYSCIYMLCDIYSIMLSKFLAS